MQQDFKSSKQQDFQVCLKQKKISFVQNGISFLYFAVELANISRLVTKLEGKVNNAHIQFWLRMQCSRIFLPDESHVLLPSQSTIDNIINLRSSLFNCLKHWIFLQINFSVFYCLQNTARSFNEIGECLVRERDIEISFVNVLTWRLLNNFMKSFQYYCRHNRETFILITVNERESSCRILKNSPFWPPSQKNNT